jgi:hypothetical protein
MKKANPKFGLINFILIPPAIITVNYIFFDFTYFINAELLLTASITTAVTALLNSQLHFLLGNYLRKKYPGFEKSFKRIVTWACVMLPITPLSLLSLFYIYRLFVLPGFNIPISKLYWAVLTGLIVDIIFLAFNEGIYTFHLWKENVQEAEQLKKANLQTQFEGLKSQVNPHFLFNTINTLSSLIHEDKARAEIFIDEMSKVYRYLLRTNEAELVSLGTELKFIDSYTHLLKTRYGNGFEVIKIIDPRFEHYLLPPLTLQLLVENSVKHNNVLKESPLSVEINVTNDGWLIVKNNLQKKIIKVDSSKIGLNNIKEKFRLLNQQEVIVEETAGAFSVKLPLIENLVSS